MKKTDISEIAAILDEIRKGNAEERASTQKIIATLTESIQTLTTEVEALRRDKAASQRAWYSPSEAEPMLGLSSYAIRTRINSGGRTQWTKRRAHGCWRYAESSSTKKPAYEIHVANWQAETDLLADKSRRMVS